MNTIVILVTELLIFSILSAVLKKIKNFSFYFGILEHSKYPLNNLISIKEKIAYLITRGVNDIPSFSFAPSDYEYWKMESERDKNCSKPEKVFLTISLIGLYIRGVIGNVLCDFIFIVTFLTLEDYIQWSVLCMNICEFFEDFESEGVVLNIIDWIQNNVNAVLIIVIVLVSLYIGLFKYKKRKYSIEEIWAEEEAERVRSVAKIQKELEDTLLLFRADIYHNITRIQEQIRFFIDTDSIKTEQMREYYKTTDKIKELLHKIVEIEGIQIYVQRNRHMYTQLTLLELLPSLSDKKIFTRINRVSKSYIQKNYKTIEDLCKAYSYGVAFINGINRFLKFSYKKRKQYNRIVLHIADADYLGGIVEKLK